MMVSESETGCRLVTVSLGRVWLQRNPENECGSQPLLLNLTAKIIPASIIIIIIIVKSCLASGRHQ